MPLTVVTLTSTIPTVSGGAVAVIDVDEFTVKLVAGVDPNATLLTTDLLLASMKLVPLIVTEVPPAVVPVVVPRLVTVGADVEIFATTNKVRFVALYWSTNRREPNTKPVTVWKLPVEDA